MAISGQCFQSTVPATHSKGLRLSSAAPVSLARSSRCLSARLAAPRFGRPSSRRSHLTRCQQQHAPEASVTCLGEALFDCLAEERGVPKEQVKTWIPYPGGAPANVAAALGRLGVKVNFVSAVGKDDLGEQMLDLLSSRQVDLSPVQRVPQPTRDVLVTRDHAGEREFSGFGAAQNDEYADCFIDASQLPEETIKNSTALVTGTLGLSFPKTADAMRTAVSYARAGPCSVLVDINWRPVFWESLSHKAVDIVSEYAGGADILKLSEEEAQWLYSVSSEDAMHHPEKVLAAVPKTVQGVLVTAGGHGAAYCFRATGNNGNSGLHKGFVPVLQVKVADTTGAGDAFLSGFLYSMVKAGGLPAFQADAEKLRSAVEFAAACGGYTCTNPGAIASQPTLEQAKELMHSAKSAV